MTPEGIAERAARIVAARCPTVQSRSEIADALRATEQSIAWFEAQRAGLIRQLSSVESFPEQTIADTSRCGLGKANKTKERSDTLADTPTLAHALEDGAITAGHVDAVARGKKKLDNADQQDEFIDCVEHLVDVAAAATIEQFQKRLDLEIKKIQRNDGEDRLTRQRKATRLSTWVDDEGMWNLRGRFDPVAGVKLAAKLDHAIEALFAQHTPEHCPSDPVEKQRFLRAHALAHLLERRGGGAKPGRPEFVVVIETSARSASIGGLASGGSIDGGGGAAAAAQAGRDLDPAAMDITAGSAAQTGHGPDVTARHITAADASAHARSVVSRLGTADAAGPVPNVEFSIPVEIPGRVLAELAAEADVHPVVLRNGVVLYAPGELDLGRSTRLASRQQRRALRAMYRCCAVPGCSVPFDRLKIHHVVWWRNGGRTDLANLLPVCSKHHGSIHNDGWIVTLGPNRELTITLPDGRSMNTGPPSRNAA